jgi:hypothetical protein
LDRQEFTSFRKKVVAVVVVVAATTPITVVLVVADVAMSIDDDMDSRLWLLLLASLLLIKANSDSNVRRIDLENWGCFGRDLMMIMMMIRVHAIEQSIIIVDALIEVDTILDWQKVIQFVRRTSTCQRKR